MRVIVSSTNSTKINAVADVFRSYYTKNGNLPGFQGAYEFNRVKVYPEQKNDPFYTQDTIVSLVINQAIEAYRDHDYYEPGNRNKLEFHLGVATKEGLVERNFGVASGYFVLECAAIYNGEKIVGIGFGTEFEVPVGMVQRLRQLKEESARGHPYPKPSIETVVYEKIKEPDSNLRYGIVGLVSKERLMRKDYVKQAVGAALWPLVSQKIYKDQEEWIKK